MLDYLILVLLSLSPVSENRGAIIYAFSAGISPWIYLPLAIILNILVIFPLFWLLKKARVKYWIYKFLGKRITNLIEKNKEKLELYEELALLFFVAIPFPGTGIWTGSIIASVLGMKPRKAKIVIAIGSIIAGIIVFLSIYGINLGITGLTSWLR